MVQKEYDSPEYFAQGLRDALEVFGDDKGINFEAKQSKGFVIFDYCKERYSIGFIKIRDKTETIVEGLVDIVKDGELIKEFGEKFRFNPNFKRTTNKGKVSQQTYIKFIKEVLIGIKNHK